MGNEAAEAFYRDAINRLNRATDREMQEAMGRCPWNPFPSYSPWGKRIDEIYRQDRARDRIRARIEQMKEQQI